MNTKDILETTPETLALAQFNLVKKEALKILKEVTEKLENNKFEEIESMLSAEPEEGSLKYDDSELYIDFSSIHPGLRNLYAVINKLDYLDSLISKN